MLEFIKTNIMAKFAVIIGTVLITLAIPMAVSAQTPTPAASNSTNIDGSVKCGSNIEGLGGTNSTCETVEGSSDIEGLIRTIINIFSVIVGSISVIMIIIGGFRYVTSAGDSNNVSGAKNTILYAIVGLIIVAFAQIIVQFVLQRTVTD